MGFNRRRSVRSAIIHSTEQDNIDLLAPVRDILEPGQLHDALEKTAKYAGEVVRDELEWQLPVSWNQPARWRKSSPAEPIYKGIKGWVADRAGQAKVYVDYSSVAVLFAHPTQFRYTKEGYRRGRLNFNFWEKALERSGDIQKELYKNISDTVNEILS